MRILFFITAAIALAALLRSGVEIGLLAEAYRAPLVSVAELRRYEERDDSVCMAVRAVAGGARTQAGEPVALEVLQNESQWDPATQSSRRVVAPRVLAVVDSRGDRLTLESSSLNLIGATTGSGQGIVENGRAGGSAAALMVPGVLERLHATERDRMTVRTLSPAARLTLLGQVVMDNGHLTLMSPRHFRGSYGPVVVAGGRRQLLWLLVGLRTPWLLILAGCAAAAWWSGRWCFKSSASKKSSKGL